MIKYFIGALALICLLVDWIIYRQIARRYPNKRWMKRLYLSHFLVLDFMILVSMIFYRQILGSDSPYYLLIIMWIIAAFFISLIPKSIYLLLSFPDQLIYWARGRRVRYFFWLGLLAGCYALGVMLWGVTEGRSRIRVNEVVIESDRLPMEFDGYRIVQFSDLHLGNFAESNTLVARMVDRINELKPDVVVNSGDLVNTNAREFTEKYMTLLKGIHAPDGVYSVLGNHDLGFYMRRGSSFTPQKNLDLLNEKYAAIGWVLLDNQADVIRRGEDSLVIAGVSYPANGVHNGYNTNLVDCDIPKAYTKIDPEAYSVLIAHTPQVWEEALAKASPDLTVAGHVHAMQFKVTLGGRSWSPAERIHGKYWSGLYEKQGRALYVNDGMGYVMYPMRIGTDPEITLFVLRSTKRVESPQSPQ